MKTRIRNWIVKLSQNLSLSFPGSFSDKAKWLASAKAIAVMLLTGSLALTTGGCVGYPEAGYGRAYYTPDYSSYYGDYGYGGEGFPGFGSDYGGGGFPGFGGGYGGELIVGGIRHRGYYGGHHFRHDHDGDRGGHSHRGGSHFSGHGGRGDGRHR